MRVRITGRQLLAALLLLSAAGAAATSPLSPSLGASAWPLILPGWPALQLPAPGTPAAPRGASLRALLQAAAEEAIAAGDGGGGSMSGGSGSSSISGGGSGRASGLPVCELDLLHRVVDVDPPGGGFASVIVLQNNRELDLSHWQVVWRYTDYASVQLEGTDGAIALSLGTPNGAPVRLVDTFLNDGIPGGGGTYSLLAEAALRPPLPGANSNVSLGIQDVNINGMPCGMKEGSGTMQYRACLEADAAGSLALDDGTSAGGGSLGGSSGACWAAFCCGVVLVDVYPPPPPPPPPPSPLPPLDTPAAPVGNEAQPQGWQQQPQQPQSNRTSSGGSGKSSAVAAAAGGGGGAAVALLLSAGVLWLRQRRRRARRLAQAATDTLAASKAGGGQGGRTLGSVLGPCTHGMRHDSMAGGASALASPSSVALTPGGCQVTIAPSIPGAPAPAGPDKSGGISASSGGSGCVGSEAGLADEITLHEQLGSGAFGVVWKASWRGSLVAVKVLQTAAAASSRELSSFQLEARVLSQLQHPHIVCFLAACTVPPNICIVEELAEGGSLHALLHGRPGARRRRPLPYARLLRLAADVADAMSYLHPRIVHRDLKSQNVLLDGQGRAKVCDFGVAKFKNTTFVSSAGGQAGTPAYMAPECFDGKAVTEKVDTYSFAVLCWEMFTGRVPWRELSGHLQARGGLKAVAGCPELAAGAIIFAVGCQRQRLPLPPSCPPFLRALIEQCWAEEPSSRPSFPAIRQRLLDELARVAAEGGGSGSSSTGSDTTCSASDCDASSFAGGSSTHGSSGSGSSSGDAGGDSSVGITAWLQRRAAGTPPLQPGDAATAAPMSSNGGAPSAASGHSISC